MPERHTDSYDAREPRGTTYERIQELEAEVAALRAERDAAIISEGCAIADREKAEAEVERMRPLVEAAEGIDGIVDFSTEGQWMRRVRNAVDTYRETK